MRTRNPDNRYRAVLEATEEPRQSFEASLWRLRKGHATEADETVAYAHEIFSKELERETMQAWLLARAEDEDIKKWLRIPEEVTQAYRHLFFNRDAFRDELDVLSWVGEMQGAGKVSERGMQLLTAAVHEGLKKIIWLFGGGEAVMEPSEVLAQVMTDTYHRGRAHRSCKLSSKELQACNNLLNAAAKTAQSMGNTGPTDSAKLQIALKFNDHTTPVTAVVEHEEILH